MTYFIRHEFKFNFPLFDEICCPKTKQNNLFLIMAINIIHPQNYDELEHVWLILYSN